MTMVIHVSLVAQSRWVNNYLEGEDPFAESLMKHYDGGYLLAGRFGPNYPSYNWLIKTDVNGEILWKKVFGMENSTLVLSADVGYNSYGDIFLVGNVFENGNDINPLILKLNSCGEKQWCRVFVDDGINYVSNLVITPVGGIVVALNQMGTVPFVDDVCLAQFDSDGNMQWKHCYNSLDTSLFNASAFNLTTSPDGGFLISGYCGYEDPNPPHSWWDKPYYIKTDSLGNFEWETVVHKEISDKGGDAWSTVLSPNNKYFYSSISHYYYPSLGDAPALLKMDMSGNVVGIYDLAQPDEYGKMIEAKFITDSTLMASALWGNVLVGGPKAVIIDTLGNIIRQTGLLQNEWLAATEVTFDGKLLYFTNINDNNGNFDAYLFKLNQQLESDTLYTQLFNYDSLCLYPIAWDTIVQDNCGLIVGMEEVYASDNNKENELHIYPNPASSTFKLQSNVAVIKGATVEIYNLYGQVIKTVIVPNGQTEIKIDVKSWDKGLYLIRMLIKGRFVANGMVIVQ